MEIPDHLVDREILDLGTDNTAGLCEVIWRLDAIFPAAPVAAKYEAADRRIRELLRSGQIGLVRQPFAQGKRLERIPDHDIDPILRSPISWYPSDSTSSIMEPTFRISFETIDPESRDY